ncbi:hypothetical protein AAFC00_004542 [Neodothiora populina]|uniref:Uncharacterized protein n=1 Tax=Neodothiora populina TaxID=2781224 RepID=A0ABR3P2P3_9PEZI
MTEPLLRRAAAILLDAWHAYRQETFDQDIVDIRWDDPQNIVLVSHFTAPKRRPAGLIYRCPKELCLDKREEVILLDQFSCGMACKHMEKLSRWLLQSIIQSLEVVFFHVQGTVFKVWQEVTNVATIHNMQPLHSVYKITLLDGSLWALDLTGSQYGWFDPVCAWQELLDIRWDYQASPPSQQPATGEGDGSADSRLSLLEHAGNSSTGDNDRWDTEVHKRPHHRASVLRYFNEGLQTSLSRHDATRALVMATMSPGTGGDSNDSAQGFRDALIAAVCECAWTAAVFADDIWADTDRDWEYALSQESDREDED